MKTRIQWVEYKLVKFSPVQLLLTLPFCTRHRSTQFFLITLYTTWVQRYVRLLASELVPKEHGDVSQSSVATTELPWEFHENAWISTHSRRVQQSSRAHVVNVVSRNNHWYISVFYYGGVKFNSHGTRISWEKLFTTCRVNCGVGWSEIPCKFYDRTVRRIPVRVEDITSWEKRLKNSVTSENRTQYVNDVRFKTEKT